ncbi:MAG: BatA domain-containing protein [Planctomycetales bacterium]|nr:BatA domain-containing protein [Planctomycetales bacterium]
MGFLTPALLGGVALIALPIILHLIKRRQPKRIDFPALQFVRRRQAANRRRLNFRHLLLLALRCALIASFAFALARPTIKGSGLRGKEGAPLAVALVIDNSVRMQYAYKNNTRLQDAAEMAKGLLRQLPEDSEIAVFDLSRTGAGFVIDAGTAEARVQNLAAENNPRPLADALREAIQLVAERKDSRQEIFLFSDLNTDAFTESALAGINESLANAPDVRIYLVDVGVEEFHNLTVQPLELRSSSLRQGEPLRIEAPVQAVGTTENPLVELYLQDSKGESIKRGQRVAELDSDGLGRVVFELADLPLGSHQGEVRLTTADPLQADNTRYFSVEVRPAAQVLLLGVHDDEVLFLREALSPSLVTDRQWVRFDCVTELYSKAAALDLSGFDAVCLVNPPPLSDELWQAIVDYADRGGGVGIFLGHLARASDFNNITPQKLLPGQLKRKSRLATYLSPQRMDHPALSGLRNFAAEIPWQVYPVFQHWEFADLVGDAYVIARYANNDPALIERPMGRGRSLTMTTSVSDPLEPVGRDPWNLLPTGPEPWPFVALSNQLVGYLAQRENRLLEYLAGETVTIQLPPQQRVSSFVLRQPDGQSLRRSLPPGEDNIRISTTSELGNYRVASGGQSRQLDRGFSINLAPELSQLTRIAPDALLASLPEQQVKLAKSLGDVERYVDIGRSGRSLFPWVISLVAIVWGAESLLANRFYREAP